MNAAFLMIATSMPTVGTLWGLMDVHAKMDMKAMGITAQVTVGL